MAAPSSSSCEVVDLSLAAIRDDATSQLFFSKSGGGGGGGDLSWPAAAAIDSKLTKQEKLVSLCDKYEVPREFTPVLAGVVGCAACETPPPPEGSNNALLCVYADALEAGLRFPLHGFYLKLLRHYGLAPSQLVPNAWKYMAAFVQLCKDAGVDPPLVSAFRHFFSVCAHKRNDRPLGWHHFTPAAAGRRLFSGTLPTRCGWKTRFFFLRSPEGMPWKCPVAWGKPRREDARTVELTDAAIEKLKQMPCFAFHDFLSLHAPPVGALTLLQSTPAPMVKPESAAASAQALGLSSVHQLQAVLEAGARAAPSAADGAAGEGDDMMWQTRRARRKRRCPFPCPDPASVTVTTPPMPQSLAISALPPAAAQGVEMAPCETSFDGAWGNSEISMPPGICPSDALDMYDAQVAIDAENARLQDKQAAQITYLQDQLQQATDRERQAKTMNAQFRDYLVAARAENAQLKDKYASEIAKLNQEHASVVAKIQEEHHKACTAHAERVKAERKAEIAKLQEKHSAEVAKLKQANDAAITWLMEEHAVDIARVQHAAEEAAADAVQDVKDIALALFPDLDASLL